MLCPWRPQRPYAGVYWRKYMALRKPDAYLWKPSAIMNSPRVERLSPLEELWYRRALDRSFDDEGLPADPSAAAIRIGRKCTPQAARKILEIFYVAKPRDPSKMINPVQEIERKNAIKALKRFSDAGKISGRKRREKKQLTLEQRSNNVATINKEINKEEEEKKKSNNGTHTMRDEPQKPVAVKPPPKTLPIEVFLGTAMAGIAVRMGLRSLPDKLDWEKHLRWAFANDFTSEDVLECYDLLRQQDWRDSPIAGKTIAKNLPQLDELRSPKPKTQSNGTNRGGGPKRTDEQVIDESKDFIRNKFGLDP